VAAQALAYRQARQAADQAERALVAARQQVHEARRALEETRREAAVRAHVPELWRRLQRAMRARDADPLLHDYTQPGASVRARARHQQRIEQLEAQIAGMLAGVAS
jgi:hypothetical protein